MFPCYTLEIERARDSWFSKQIVLIFIDDSGYATSTVSVEKSAPKETEDNVAQTEFEISLDRLDYDDFSEPDENDNNEEVRAPKNPDAYEEDTTQIKTNRKRREITPPSRLTNDLVSSRQILSTPKTRQRIKAPSPGLILTSNILFTFMICLHLRFVFIGFQIQNYLLFGTLFTILGLFTF